MLSACFGGQDHEPSKPASVALSADHVKDLKLGLVVSLSSPEGQGRDYLDAVEGVEVAASRYKLGGVDLDFEVVDDKGSRADADKAVASLVEKGVSGIIFGTAGDHLVDAMHTASEAGVPVIAPYLRVTEDIPQGVYVTGPSEDTISDLIGDSLAQSGTQTPLVLSVDGTPVPNLPSGDVVDVKDLDATKVARDVKKAFDKNTNDSVVMSAPAAYQGRLFAKLQEIASSRPAVMTPEALTQAFADSLVKVDGTPSGEMQAVGVESADIVTLGDSEQARTTSAFFAALRLLAQESGQKSIIDGQPLAETVSGADAASHDAVIAFVRAASKADSKDPKEVANALAQLKLTVADELAGPSLDFSTAYPLDETSVMLLHATTQDPGVRPAKPLAASDVNSAPRLFWFGYKPESP